MKSHDTDLRDRSFATVRFPAATIQFQELAKRLALKVLAGNLLELSLNANESKFLCGILCFLKEPEVIKLCSLWGQEEYLFLDLAKLGEAIWHDTKVPASRNDVHNSLLDICGASERSYELRVLPRFEPPLASCHASSNNYRGDCELPYTLCQSRAAEALKFPMEAQMHPIPVWTMKFNVPDIDQFHPLYIAGNAQLS